MSPKCYNSLNNKKKPRCKVNNEGCTTCKKALVAYFKAREIAGMKRKKNNRKSAARSRQKRKEKSANIVAEHTALIQQQKDQESYFYQLARDKMQLRQLIKKKMHERNSRREVMAQVLAKELVKCPKDSLNHLQNQIAASINSGTPFNSTH